MTITQSVRHAIIQPAPAQPELVIRLSRPGKQPACILIEAKLLSGKSSRPTETGPVNDQLARYWIQLKRRADAAQAVPLAVVYVTAGVTLPELDFRETQDELARKEPTAARAPLYWLSWRDFVGSVDCSKAILRDSCRLLRDRWQLVHAEMTAWPAPPRSLTQGDTPSWSFTRDWRWSVPPPTNFVWRFAAERRRT